MNRLTHALLAGLLMLACSGAAKWLTPTLLLAQQRTHAVDLENDVPRQFGGWTLEPTAPNVVNPQTQEMLDRIYTQVLSRSYVNAQGQRVMLSVAYGADQRRRAGLQLHQPEVCYPAQGFEVLSKVTGSLQAGTSALPVKRLETVLQGQRYEPVTYWLMTGDHANVGGAAMRRINIAYGLQRIVPDGLLFRVSSIGRNSAAEFELQGRFVNDLLASLDATTRKELAGL